MCGRKQSRLCIKAAGISTNSRFQRTGLRTSQMYIQTVSAYFTHRNNFVSWESWTGANEFFQFSPWKMDACTCFWRYRSIPCSTNNVHVQEELWSPSYSDVLADSTDCHHILGQFFSGGRCCTCTGVTWDYDLPHDDHTKQWCQSGFATGILCESKL